MQSKNSGETERPPGLGARLGLAWRVLVDAAFARDVTAGLKTAATKPVRAEAPPLAPREPSPAEQEGSGLFVLSALQRDGRLIDFLQQDVAGFSDEDVGAAARVVHGGCRKVLQQYFAFVPAVESAEGSAMTVPVGFNAQKIRLTGNVTGNPPFKGTVKHHGWVAKEVRLPALTQSLDLRIVAPAEVELA